MLRIVYVEGGSWGCIAGHEMDIDPRTSCDGDGARTLSSMSSDMAVFLASHFMAWHIRMNSLWSK